MPLMQVEIWDQGGLAFRIVDSIVGNFPSFTIPINGFKLGVPRFRTDWLAESPYEDVTDELTLSITDGTLHGSNSTLTRLDTLINELIHAERRPQYKNSNGAIGYLFTEPMTDPTYQAALIPSTLQLIDLPTDYPSLYDNGGKILNVKARYQRRGWFHITGGSATITANSADTTNGSVASIALSGGDSQSCYCPVQLDINTIDATAVQRGIVLAKDTGIRHINAACNAGTATGYTSVADAANFPSVGATNILRYTPTGTTTVRSGGIVNIATTNYFPAALFLKYRNNGSTAYTVRAVIVNNSNVVAASDYQVIPAGAGNPTILKLGLMSMNDQFAVSTAQTLALEVQASAAASSIDFDSITMWPVDPWLSMIVEHGPSAINTGFPSDPTLKFQHNFPGMTPTVLLTGSTIRRTLDNNDYLGRPYFFIREQQANPSIDALWLLTDGTSWTKKDLTGTARMLNIYTATVLKAWLRPR